MDRIIKSFEGIPPRWDFMITKRDGLEGQFFGSLREEGRDVGVLEGVVAQEFRFGDIREPMLRDALETCNRSRW